MMANQLQERTKCLNMLCLSSSGTNMQNEWNAWCCWTSFFTSFHSSDLRAERPIRLCTISISGFLLWIWPDRNTCINGSHVVENSWGLCKNAQCCCLIIFMTFPYSKGFPVHEGNHSKSWLQCLRLISCHPVSVRTNLAIVWFYNVLPRLTIRPTLPWNLLLHSSSLYHGSWYGALAKSIIYRLWCLWMFCDNYTQDYASITWAYGSPCRANRLLISSFRYPASSSQKGRIISPCAPSPSTSRPLHHLLWWGVSTALCC